MSSDRQGQRHQQREMRLVAERAKADAGKDRPAVDEQRCGAE